MFKQQNPCSKHEIPVMFEHGFWLKSVDIIGQCDVTSVFRGNKMADVDEAPQFFNVFTLIMLFLRYFK